MTPQFRGNYSHSIDAKGRIIIPVKFRDALGESFVVTRGVGGCLYAFANDEWEDFAAKFDELPLYDDNARKMKYFFVGGAFDVEPDKQGRILLPESLLQYAGIEKEAVVVGMGTRLELWSAQRWSAAFRFEETADITQAMSAYDLRF